MASVILAIFDLFFNLSNFQRHIIYLFDLLVVMVLAMDFVKQIIHVKSHRLQFIVTHWYELPAMVPIIFYLLIDTHIALGLILRGIRILMFFRFLRVFKIISFFKQSEFLYLALFTSLTIIFGAFSIYFTESSIENAIIKDLDDAFWWSVGIVTTIAPNNLYSVTIEGQVIASVMMFISIGIIATSISTVGARLINRASTSMPSEIPSKNDNFNDHFQGINITNTANLENNIYDKKTNNNVLIEEDIIFLKQIIAIFKGANIEQYSATDQYNCRICGKLNPFGSLYCNNCGDKI